MTKKIFNFIFSHFESSSKGVFSKREIFDILDRLESEWTSESTREMDRENKEVTLKSWKREEEEDGRVKID